MAFNAAFEIVPSVNPSLVILSDTSTGSDVNLTGRTVYIYTSTGDLFVPALAWAIDDETITLDILSQDEALNIRVDWTSSDPEPDPSTYTYSQIYAFTRYGKNYVYYLTQLQTANPSISQDDNYYGNKLKLLCEILSAENAINVGEDVFAAAQCISRYTYLISNAQYYF